MPTSKRCGEGMLAAMYPATALIKDMSAGEVRAAYVFYIGAGAGATGGIIALARAFPTIVGAFASGFASLRASRLGQAVTAPLPTHDDLPTTGTVIGSFPLAFGPARL